MHAQLVWEAGFPEGVQIVADEEYQLTIESVRAIAPSGCVSVEVTFVQDGEYRSWREVCSENGIIRLFFEHVGVGVRWSEATLLFITYLGTLDPADEACILLDIYSSFLLAAKIPLQEALIPDVHCRTV